MLSNMECEHCLRGDAENIDIRYCRMNIPVGSVYRGIVYCHCFTTFRTLMAVWNRVGGKTWKFWED